MTVRILKDPVGMYRLCYEVGEVIDLPDAQARELIETGHAEMVATEFKPKSEKATSKVKPEKR